MSRTTRQVLDLALGAARYVKKVGAISWKYLKVEAVPPLTVSFFNGPFGRKLENSVGNIANRFIGSIDSKIKEMDAEAEKERLEILAAIKAHENKVKAEARQKELERIKEIARKAAEEVKKAAALAEQKQAEIDAAKPKEEEKKRKTKAKDKRKGKGKRQKPPPRKTK